MDRRGEPPGALGQARPEALAAGGHLDESDYAAPIAPAEGHADLVLVEPAALERLRHERDRDADRDGIHPDKVTKARGMDEGFGLQNADHLSLRDVHRLAGHRALRACG